MKQKNFDDAMRLAEIGRANYDNGKRVIKEPIRELIEDIRKNLKERERFLNILETSDFYRGSRQTSLGIIASLGRILDIE